MVGPAVDAGLAVLCDGLVGRRRCEMAGGAGLLKEGMAEGVVVEEAVDIAAPDSAGVEAGPVQDLLVLAFTADPREGLCSGQVSGCAHVDLVAGEGAGACVASDATNGLTALHGGADGEPAQRGGAARGTDIFDAVRIVDPLAQHLETAADADDWPRAADHLREAVAVQPLEIVNRLLGAGQDQDIRHGCFFGALQEGQGDRGLHGEGVEVSEVCHVWQGDDADAERAGGALRLDSPEARGAAAVFDGDAVFLFEAEVGEEVDYAGAGDAQALLHHLDAGVEQADVATELVDDEGANARSVFGGEELDGAVEGGEDAASVYVSNEEAVGFGGMSHAHVDDVVVAEVDLGGGAGTLQEDEVVGGGEPAIALDDGGEEGGGAVLEVVLGGDLAPDLAQQDDLGSGFGTRLDEHRIHVGAGRGAAGFGLQGLGAADLAAIGGGGGVKGHVLGFEGGDAVAFVGEDAAESGGEEGLAGVGGGAEDHQSRSSHWIGSRMAQICGAALSGGDRLMGVVVPMTGPPEEQKDAIRQQLQRILSSAAFAGSERHRRFLTFVVEQALKGDTEKLNEFVLGFEVFHKGDTFDPRIDSIVRVEARRLRERLKKYYQEDGPSDPLIVTLRPRSFVPEFTPRERPAGTQSMASRWLHNRRVWLVAAVALVAGAAGTAGFFVLRPKPFGLDSMTSVLVLPFQTLRGAPDPELGTTISDALIAGLTGRPGVRVMARGSAGGSTEARFQLAADLQADYIVEGAVRVTGSRAVVSAKMTDVHSQSYVWAETREGETGQMGALEQELTGAILSRIRRPAGARGKGPPGPARPATNPKAYGAFLKGQFYWYQGDPESLRRSVALFEETLHGDPNFAPAWAWLAQCYLLEVFQGDGRDAAVLAKGRAAAAKALALDGESAEAQAAAGSYAALDWNWPEAEVRFRKAIELNPSWAQGHMLFSMMYLVPTGHFPEAVRAMFQAHSLDPLTRITRSMLAEVLYFNRDYARAIAESEDLAQGQPGRPGSRAYVLSLCLSGQGKRAQAELAAQFEGKTDDPMGLALYGYVLGMNGERSKAEAVLQRLTQQGGRRPLPAMALAMLEVGLQKNEEALGHLREAVAQHVPACSQIAADPVFAGLRKDARFVGLLGQMGLR